MTPEEQIKALEKKVDDLVNKFASLDKQTIRIVGDVASTTVPVTIQGIRRKITHSAP